MKTPLKDLGRRIARNYTAREYACEIRTELDQLDGLTPRERKALEDAAWSHAHEARRERGGR